MKYLRFEDLPVWKTAISLAVGIFRLTSSGIVSRFSGFKNQIERASVSVSNNIAEGFERGTHEELLTFLYIARGSAGEVRSMLFLLQELMESQENLAEIEELKALSLSITRQLNAWLDSLKKTNEVGHRHQTVQRREATENARRRDEYLAYIKEVQEEQQLRLRRATEEPSS
jgi:four helix bundle protein